MKKLFSILLSAVVLAFAASCTKETVGGEHSLFQHDGTEGSTGGSDTGTGTGGGTNTGGGTSTTVASFKFPCVNWGSSRTTVKSYMSGYTLLDEESFKSDGYTWWYLNYEGKNDETQYFYYFKSTSLKEADVCFPSTYYTKVVNYLKNNSFTYEGGGTDDNGYKWVYYYKTINGTKCYAQVSYENYSDGTQYVLLFLCPYNDVMAQTRAAGVTEKLVSINRIR